MFWSLIKSNKYVVENYKTWDYRTNLFYIYFFKSTLITAQYIIDNFIFYDILIVIYILLLRFLFVRFIIIDAGVKMYINTKYHELFQSECRCNF